MNVVVDKSTKCCQLSVQLKSGVRVVGLLHVPSGTTSTIRPSDAIAERASEFLLLSDVTLSEHNVPRQHPAIMIPYDAISHIELPPSGWVSRKATRTAEP